MSDAVIIDELEYKLKQVKKYSLTKKDELRKTLDVFNSFPQLPDSAEAERQKLLEIPKEISLHVIAFGDRIKCR